MELMDGVILLEEYTDFTNLGNVVFFISVITCIASVIALSNSIIFSSEREGTLIEKVIDIIVVIIGCLSIIGFFASFSPVFREETGRLEVIITQDADMDELLEQYTIIDHENGKYIIEKKE
ncbi:MAG: hypothetical protein IJ496_06610 [Ruminococcus sp.]|nr:hypothetical protein [Ruminococcus sp.]